jgi:hypothetical protein
MWIVSGINHKEEFLMHAAYLALEYSSNSIGNFLKLIKVVDSK